MKSIINALQPKIYNIFDHLHKHPEISWKEFETAKFIRSHLEHNGCRIQEFDDFTGVVGEIGEGPPTVAIRADMDALWQKVDGEFRANHSCGHDANMSIALGVLYTLKKLPMFPKGKIKFIFQPAEEKGTGALKIIEKKVVEDVDYLYGVHLRPIQEIENGKATPALVHSAALFIIGEIIGEDSHGARPHLGTNAIEVGAALVQKLSQIHLDPMIPYSVKLTKFIAGTESANIIPGSASFSIDLRAQTNDAMTMLVEKVEKAVKTLAEFYDVEIRLSSEAYTAAAEVNINAQEIMAASINDVLGAENLLDPLITTGGDDFNFYALKHPNLKSTMLGLGSDLKPGLHHPNMTFDHKALLTGIEILTNAVIRTLEKENGGRE